MWLVLSSPYIVYMAYVLYREICTMIRTKRYNKITEMHQYYKPFYGCMSLHTPESYKSRDLLDRFKNTMDKAASLNKLAVVSNNPWKWNACIHLIDIDTVRDFMTKEMDFTLRIPFSRLPWSSSFAYLPKDRASVETRKLLVKMMGREGVSKNHSTYVKYCQKIVGAIIEEKDKENKKRIDVVVESQFFLRKFYQLMFLGEGTNGVRIYGGKVKIFDALHYAQNATYSDKGFFQFVNIMMGGLPARFGLISALNQSKKIAKESLAALENLMEMRLSSEDYEPSRNFFDLSIHHNDKYPDNKISIEEIFATIMDCIGLGLNQTASLMSNAIFVLAANEEQMLKVKEEISTVKDVQNMKLEEMENLVYLDAFVKECLRKYNPYFSSESRLVLKDMKVGKSSIPIFAGDIVQIPLVHLSHHPNASTDPSSFSPSLPTTSTGIMKGKKEESKKYNMPHMIGARACPAEYTSEYLVKLFIISFISSYDISIEEKDISLVRYTCTWMYEVHNLHLHICPSS